MVDQTRNLTWVIGDWRFYVARVELDEAVKQAHQNPEMERWQWNVRFNPIGWEEYAETDAGREQAIVEALKAIEQLQHEQYVTNYYVTTSTQDGTVAAKPQMPISEFIRAAHQQLVGGAFDPTIWHLEGVNGWDYDPALPIGVTCHRPITLRASPIDI